MKREFRLTDEQDAALMRAAKAAGVSIDRFVVNAVRSLAGRYGVEVPAAPERKQRVQPSGVTLLKNPGGRPRKPADHPMERHVPAGYRAAVCAWCHRDFRVDDEVTVFCSERCEKRAQSFRNYGRRKARAK